jgi:hypothetical protein
MFNDLDERKLARMQCLQDTNQSNEDNPKSVRREGNRYFRKKEGIYESRVNKLETNSRKRNVTHFYRGISDFKEDYQPRNNIVRNCKVIRLPQYLARWRNHICQPLNVHWVNDVRQTEIHIPKPLLPQPSAFEEDMAIQKVKGSKSPGTD